MKKLIVLSILVSAVLSFALAGCDDSDSACTKAAKYFVAMAVDEDPGDTTTVATVADNCENGGDLPGGATASPWTDLDITCVMASSTTTQALICAADPD